MKNLAQILIATVAAMSATACSTLNINKDRVHAVKKVAVVGFGVEEEMPPKMEIKIGGSKKSDADRGIGSLQVSPLPEDSEHAQTMYVNLAEMLKNDLKWSIEQEDALAHQPEYLHEFRTQTSGWHSRQVSGPNTANYTAPGIMEAWAVERMDKEERRALLDKLGVDAIATAQVSVHLQKGGGLEQLVGAGSYFPQATLTFKVYDRSSDEPIWMDTWANGEPVAEGTGHFMGLTDPRALHQQAVVAAQGAYQKLLERYHNREAGKE